MKYIIDKKDAEILLNDFHKLISSGYIPADKVEYGVVYKEIKKLYEIANKVKELKSLESLYKRTRDHLKNIVVFENGLNATQWEELLKQLDKKGV